MTSVTSNEFLKINTNQRKKLVQAYLNDILSPYYHPAVRKLPCKKMCSIKKFILSDRRKIMESESPICLQWKLLRKNPTKKSPGVFLARRTFPVSLSCCFVKNDFSHASRALNASVLYFFQYFQRFTVLETISRVSLR